VYFAGRLLGVSEDRLGSVRYGGASGVGYQAQYPYGVEYTPTTNDREKYATYTRDSLTGLDYAVNRYYTSPWGRFLSPDRSWRALNEGHRGNVRNDPVNHTDPEGLNLDEDCDADGNCWLVGDGCDGDACNLSGIYPIFSAYGVDDGDEGDNNPGGPVPDPEPTPPDPPSPSNPPSPSQPQPAATQCQISLWERGVPVSWSPFGHTYLEVSDSELLDTVEGGPDFPILTRFGYMLGTIAPAGQGLPGTNPGGPGNAEMAPPYYGANACGLVNEILGDLSHYNSYGPWVWYDYTATWSYNSNSFTYTLLSQTGLLAFFGHYPGGSLLLPGWGKLVPGL